MHSAITTAVVAAAAAHVRRQAIAALSAVGIELLAMASHAADALQFINTHRPDVLIADMELPGMEGSALARQVLNGFSLPVRPKVMVLRYPEFPVAGENELRALGAAFVEKPIGQNAFSAAIEALSASMPLFSAEAHRHVNDLLDVLGVPNHMGRECLHYAALICASDERVRCKLNERLYPQLAALCRMDTAQVERAMRHVISLAWQSDKLDNQNRIFENTVDAGRGQPTCGEMISRLADILRLEG